MEAARPDLRRFAGASPEKGDVARKMDKEKPAVKPAQERIDNLLL
jgi:hypothetical protein